MHSLYNNWEILYNRNSERTDYDAAHNNSEEHAWVIAGIISVPLHRLFQNIAHQLGLLNVVHWK